MFRLAEAKNLSTQCVGRLIILSLFLFVAQMATAQSFEAASPGEYIGHSAVCNTKQGCRLQVRDDAVTVTSDGYLLKSTEPTYEVKLINDREQVHSATISQSGNVIAVAIEKITRSRRAFGGMPRPDDLDRSYRITLYNPRSSSLIKSFDFGTRAIRTMGISEDGQVLMVATQDTDRRANHQIIAYNARSGATILDRSVEEARNVTIGSSGFEFDGQRLVLRSESSNQGVAVYNSRDPFSIAEYQIECSKSILSSAASNQSISIGVMEIDDEATQQGLALADALSSGLAQGGVRLVERSKIREVLEEIQLSTTGLTESQVAVDVGRLGVANYLVFGRASRNERNISSSVRLVSVEQGEIEASCSMICRDCENQDLYEGFLKLAEHWST